MRVPSALPHGPGRVIRPSPLYWYSVQLVTLSLASSTSLRAALLDVTRQGPFLTVRAAAV